MTDRIQPNLSPTLPPVPASAAGRGSQYPGRPSSAQARPADLSPSAAASPHDAASLRPRTGSPQGASARLGAAVQSRTPATIEVLAALGDLRQLAGQLHDLEQDHARALTAIRKMDPADASSSAATDPGAGRLGRLEHGLKQARAQREHCHSQLTSRKDELKRIEQLLAKAQPRLDGLQAPHQADTSTAPAPRTGPPHQPRAEAPARPTPDTAPASAQTVEAKALLTELERQFESLRNEYRRELLPRMEAAKQAALRQSTAADELLSAEKVLAVLDQEAKADKLKLHESFGVPNVEAQTQFEQHLAWFTEPDSTGALQVRPDLLQGEQCSAILSALCRSAAEGTVITTDLLGGILLSREMQAGGMKRLVTSDSTQNADLKAAVSAGFDSMRDKMLHQVNHEKVTANQLLGRRAKAWRAKRQAAIRPLETAITLLDRHREEFQASLLDRTTQVLSVIAGNYHSQVAVAQTLERQLEACNQALSSSMGQIKTKNTERQAAQATLQRLQDTDRAAARAAAPAAAPAGAATVPLTATAPAGPDLEARTLKLKGALAELADQHKTANSLHQAADDAHKSAVQEERKAEAAYETAVAEHGRAQDSARRAHAEAQEMRAAQREQLAGLASQVTEAQNALMNHPALASLLEPTKALGLAIDRHVKPTDKEQYQRAKHETGYAGTYHSLGHLVEAACDVYEDATRHCPGLFAARSRVEFEAAARLLKAEGQSTVDRVHEHRRAAPIARGYSSALDQTESPVPVKESCYSLRWQEGSERGSEKGSGSQGGHVIISHLYPFVPHRQLRTLEP